MDDALHLLIEARDRLDRAIAALRGPREPERDAKTDFPKGLGNEIIRQQRLAMLHEPHIRPLAELVELIRRKKGLSEKVPYFDPLDGGIGAKVLFLLEAPGAKAVRSGFVSRNNPDPTAKNLFIALQETGLARADTVLWNIVPWYIGSDDKIRAARKGDIEAGRAYLPHLLEQLPKLKAVALVGLKAQRVRSWLEEDASRQLKIFDVRHPSQQSLNRHPINRSLLVKSLRDIADFLASP